jgi:hypothetical protein
MERQGNAHRFDVVDLAFLDFENVDRLEVEGVLPGHVTIDKRSVRAINLEDFFFHGMAEHCHAERETCFLIRNPHAPEVDAVDVIENSRVDLSSAGLRNAADRRSSAAGRLATGAAGRR